MNKFDEFYSHYPRKRNRAGALKAWGKIPTDLHDMIIEDVKLRVMTEWRGKDKKWIPYPASWLNNNRWEDELELPQVNWKEKSDKELVEAAEERGLRTKGYTRYQLIDKLEG